jgi:hypothetical protein
MEYRFGRFLSRARVRNGWAVAIEDGVIAPADLLLPPEDAARCEVFIDGLPAEIPVDGRRMLPHGLVFVPYAHELSIWSASFRRPMEAPEDCLIYQGSESGPLALTGARLEQSGDGFNVDASVGLRRADHGAAVVSGVDGKLVGLLVVDEDDRARVVSLP